MGSDLRPTGWIRAVPVADPTLCECELRVTARDARARGSLLARLRVARGRLPAEQARDPGLSVSALVFLSLCHLPDPGRRGPTSPPWPL